MESNLLLIVGTLIYKDRVEVLSFMLHRLPRKWLEHRVACMEKRVVIVLEKDRMLTKVIHDASGKLLNAPITFLSWNEVQMCLQTVDSLHIESNRR